MICQLASLNNYIINWSLRQRQQSLSWRYFNHFGCLMSEKKPFEAVNYSDIEFQLNIAWVWAISCFEREAQTKKLKTVRKLITKLWRNRSRKTIRNKCIHCKDTLFQRYVIDTFQISLTICNSWTKWKIFSQLYQ